MAITRTRAVAAGDTFTVDNGGCILSVSVTSGTAAGSVTIDFEGAGTLEHLIVVPGNQERNLDIFVPEGGTIESGLNTTTFLNWELISGGVKHNV